MCDLTSYLTDKESFIIVALPKTNFLLYRKCVFCSVTSLVSSIYMSSLAKVYVKISNRDRPLGGPLAYPS